MQASIYERITNQIILAIEEGARDYVMPWHAAGKQLYLPTNAVSGRAYRGLNVLILWISGQAGGFETGQWATYKQWSSIGAQVRKGERGSSIFFWQNRAVQQKNDQCLDERRRPGFVGRCFTVFNADQVTGFRPSAPPVLDQFKRQPAAEYFVRATRAVIQHGGDRAFYAPAADRIQIPEFAQFRTSSGYYSVLAHELTHWAGAKHRTDRDLSQRFGSHDYAMEELIAELGSAFTCARLEIGTEPRLDHAPYISSWLAALRDDPRAIFTTASKAQAACDYLLGLSNGLGRNDQSPLPAVCPVPGETLPVSVA